MIKEWLLRWLGIQNLGKRLDLYRAELEGLGDKLKSDRFDLLVSLNHHDEILEAQNRRLQSFGQTLEEHTGHVGSWMSECDRELESLRARLEIQRGATESWLDSRGASLANSLAELDAQVSGYQEEHKADTQEIWSHIIENQWPQVFNADIAKALPDAKALAAEAEKQSASGTSGEYKRHVVMAKLAKKYPTIPARDLALAVELAVRDVLPKFVLA